MSSNVNVTKQRRDSIYYLWRLSETQTLNEKYYFGIRCNVTLRCEMVPCSVSFKHPWCTHTYDSLWHTSSLDATGLLMWKAAKLKSRRANTKKPMPVFSVGTVRKRRWESGALSSSLPRFLNPPTLRLSRSLSPHEFAKVCCLIFITSSLLLARTNAYD